MLTAPGIENQSVSRAIQAAVDSTFSIIWGEKPVLCPHRWEQPPSASVAGIISFTGDVSFSTSLVLPREAAPAMVMAFTGMDLPFDSGDMGDAVAELVNILAGDVVAQLDARRLKVQMGLPMVARGCPLELMAAKSNRAVSLDFQCKHGRFWLALVSPPEPGSWRKTTGQ